MAELKGNKYGTHRVIEPKGVLTQAAWKVDNDMTKVYSNEIVCDVTSEHRLRFLHPDLRRLRRRREEDRRNDPGHRR